MKTEQKSKTGQLFNSFENTYANTSVNQWEGERLAFLPLLVETTNNKKLVITEADLENYPGMFLENADKDATLKSFFAPYPKTMKQGGHNMLQELVTERKIILPSVGQKHYSHGELSLYHQEMKSCWIMTWFINWQHRAGLKILPG